MVLIRPCLKNFGLPVFHIGWFPRDYRAVVHEENWANYPFKRKLYIDFLRFSFLYVVVRHNVLTGYD